MRDKFKEEGLMEEEICRNFYHSIHLTIINLLKS